MTYIIEETSDFRPCLALRLRVFVEEQGIALEEEIDELDQTAIHLLGTEGDTPAGTARLLRDGDTGRIGRICVLPEHRGTGLGAALVRHGIARLRADGVADIRLGAQIHALAFYQKLGFAAEGPEYDDAGIPHREMRLIL